MKWLNQLTAFSTAAVFAATTAIPPASIAQDAAAQPAAAQPAAAQPAAAQAPAGQEAAGQPAAAQSAPADPAAAQEAAAQAEQPAGEQKNQAPRKLEVIELQHRDPQQLTQLMGLWDQVAMPGYGGRVTVQRPDLQQQPHERLAIAFDNQKKMMFVRGTAEQIEKIKTLIAAIDVADEGLKPYDFANHRLIPVPSDSSGQIQSTLTQLDLAGQVIRVGNTTFIAYKAGEEDAERRQQAEMVINKLAAQPPAEGQPAEGQPAEGQPAAAQPAAGQPAGGQPAAQPAPGA